MIQDIAVYLSLPRRIDYFHLMETLLSGIDSKRKRLYPELPAIWLMLWMNRLK